MIYFFSDVHLGIFERSEDEKREQLLLEFLRKIQPNCKELLIVGDLFDYWFEYKTVTPKYFYRTLAALKWLKDSGCKIEYLMGNHDFGHVDFFEKELGIPVYSGDLEKVYSGKKFFISHGDGKGKGDTGYKMLKKVLRSPVAQWSYKLLHPNIGISLASSSSRTSRGYSDKKDAKMGDFLVDFAEHKIIEGFDFVVMGHLHKARIKNFGKGKYINLGEWINKPTFGMFNGNQFKLAYVKDFINGKLSFIKEENVGKIDNIEIEAPFEDEYKKRVPGSRRIR